jgi:hypothetical protein
VIDTDLSASGSDEKWRRVVTPGAEGEAWLGRQIYQARSIHRRLLPGQRSAQPRGLVGARRICVSQITLRSPQASLRRGALTNGRAHTYAEAKATHDICGSDGQNALWQAHPPMDRRSLGVLTSDGPDLCEAIGAMEAHRRRNRRRGDGPAVVCSDATDPFIPPPTREQLMAGSQLPPRLQGGGVIPVFAPSDAPAAMTGNSALRLLRWGRGGRTTQSRSA